MKWTPVGSHGLEVVLEPQADERVNHALKKLQNSSHGFLQVLNFQTDHHIPGACRQIEPLKALFFLAREPIGRWVKAAAHVFYTCPGKYSCFCHFGGSAK